MPSLSAYLFSLKTNKNFISFNWVEINCSPFIFYIVQQQEQQQ